MPQLHSGLIGGSKYQITNSVRLRAGASAYFSRTFGTPTTQDTFTFSAWVKRSKLSSLQNLLGVSTNTSIGFPAADTLVVTCAGSATITTSGLYRDPSAWCHVQYKQTTGAATLYFNGVSVGTSATVSAVFNTAVAHQLGAANTSNYTDGYLSDIYFVDGQALTPSSFGKADASGVWVPKAYTGTYGNNGFHLDFRDANLTAGSNVGLGKDVSGNGNYWNTNNISVTAGVTYDSMVDTPTNNYPTLNAVQPAITAPSNGALNVNWTASTPPYTQNATMFASSGKYYWECTVSGANVGQGAIGVVDPFNYTANLIASGTGTVYLGNGHKYTNAVDGGVVGATWSAGNVIGCALDIGGGTIAFYVNNALQFTAAITGGSGSWMPCVASNSSTLFAVMQLNFGQRPFTYTPPTGFKALCTANQTIAAPTASGTFTGNLNADGPFVWIGGVPSTLTINSNAVTFGTHADKTAGGFKLRTASASYNNTGSNTWSATFASPSTNSAFAHPQPAQGNP